ncbi:MAG: hypothetical protein KC680_01155 [Candidatus Peregrinibacteria bacterium]|nr:hypothetical protein [Candidatus Peregrinibacteria bacterium]MCB9807835.1 hypothetical protein [Candidatus Peribacteria bacterium]
MRKAVYMFAAVVWMFGMTSVHAQHAIPAWAMEQVRTIIVELSTGALTTAQAIDRVSTVIVEMANAEPRCGNGKVEGSEHCDDGNVDTKKDGCNQWCRLDQGWSCTGQPSVCYELCGDGQCNYLSEFLTCPRDCPAQYSGELYPGNPDTIHMRVAGIRAANTQCGNPGVVGCVKNITMKSYGYLAYINPVSSPAPGNTLGTKTKFIAPGKGSVMTNANVIPHTGFPQYYTAGDHTYTMYVSEWNYVNGSYAPPVITPLDALTIHFTIVEPESAARLQITSVTLEDEGEETENIVVEGTLQRDAAADEMLSVHYTNKPLYIAPNGTFTFRIWKNQTYGYGAPDDAYIQYDLEENRCPTALWLASKTGKLAGASSLPDKVYAYKNVCVP